MNRTRWLIVLLIVSWTLNVALAVALYLKSGYRTDDLLRVGDAGPPVVRTAPPPPFGPMGPDFRRDITPLKGTRGRLFSELAGSFNKDELDTSRILLISDSLNEIRGQMQRCFVRHLARMHDDLPPEARHRLAQMIMHRLEGDHGPGPHRPLRMERQHRRIKNK